MGKRSYAVVGVGAIGGLYGARLVADGHEVHFLARSDTEHIATHGLKVQSPWGDQDLTDVSVATDPAELPAVDVVILAVKTTETEAALPLVAELAGAEATVVVLQNGLGVEEMIARALPGHPVLGGMCFTCAHKVGPGHVHHLDQGRVSMGEWRPGDEPAGLTPTLLAVVDDFSGAGVPTTALEDLAEGRWRKLAWNIPFNGLSVVLDAGTDALVADPASRELVIALMSEVLAGAAACEHTIEPELVDALLANTETMTPYATSMKLDYDAGRPLELERIFAAPLLAARAAGFEMARTHTLWSQLRFLDRRRSNLGSDD